MSQNAHTKPTVEEAVRTIAGKDNLLPIDVFQRLLIGQYSPSEIERAVKETLNRLWITHTD